MNADPDGAAKANHPWSADALLAKAQRYAEEMMAHPHDDWRFGLASTFVLEFVARAALARVSPVLLAESKDPQGWDNIYFALGHTPKRTKFIPKSVAVVAVIARMGEILPAFTEELRGFAIQHVNRRNEELHAGSTPFDSLRTSWLATFYETCKVLLASIGEPLSALVGAEESGVADALIEASHDSSAKAVLKSIEEHRRIWEAKSTQEREKAAQQSSVWATRQAGHRVSCPACENDALLMGTPFSEPSRRLDGNLIVEVQEYLPAKFECIACRLKIAGLSQLTASGLGNTYKLTSTYDAADYYAPDDLRLSMNDEYPTFDDDNNEY